jgi:hypothetical protein
MLVVVREKRITAFISAHSCSPHKTSYAHPWHNFIQQQFQLGAVLVVDADQHHSIVAQQIAGEGEPAVEEFQPGRMTPAVVLRKEPVVVDPVLVAGVVGRIDIDALDPAGVGHPQPAQGVVVVTLDNEVGPGGRPLGEVRNRRGGDEGRLHGPGVAVDGVPLPHQPQLLFTVLLFEQGDQPLSRQRIVFSAALRHARFLPPPTARSITPSGAAQPGRFCPGLSAPAVEGRKARSRSEAA